MSDSIVKSVGRVFEVLELFDAERVALSATTIARTLKYPASSTVALLKSMVNLGYLAYDHNDRMYFPTLRLPLLGAWMESGLYADGHLFQLIDEVQAATDESIFLSWQSDLDMRYVRVRGGLNKDTSLPTEDSSRVSLFSSVSGLLTLSQKRDVEIVKLAERLNALRRGNEPQVDLPGAMETIRRFRMQGHGVGYDGLVPGFGTIAWTLRRRTGAVLCEPVHPRHQRQHQGQGKGGCQRRQNHHSQAWRRLMLNLWLPCSLSSSPNVSIEFLV